MTIALLGDVHGCVRHALAACVALEARLHVRFEAIIQLGDMGLALARDPDDPGDYHLDDNPAQRDGIAINDEGHAMADSVRLARQILGQPVLYLSGNHEGWPLIEAAHSNGGGAVAEVDPAGAFAHVADGTVLTTHTGTKIGFLGGIDWPGAPFDLDDTAIETLAATPDVDVLVTHEGPYGVSVNWQGRTQGSKRITALIEQMAPRWHVHGHYHHRSGPTLLGRTESYMLAGLVDPKADRWNRLPPNPDQRVTAGSIALLDPVASGFSYLDVEKIADIGGDDLDLAGVCHGRGV